MLLNGVVKVSQFLSGAFLRAWDLVDLPDVSLVDEARAFVSRLEGLDGFGVLVSRARQPLDDRLP